jgi:murein DD-endopeptidase MepM/ murein hydrolase activator NlpD
MIGNSDPRYYAPEFKDGGDVGNNVVIDHGNGEFSMIAHFQQNSVSVKSGDRVAAGQLIGRLGSSGDSTAPHVHHQLQSGPDWTTSDALPHHYENGPGKRHDRGWMFNAR